MSFVGDSPINWKTQLQKTVANSTTEAEYMATKIASLEGLYLLHMLQWLQEQDLVKLTKNFVTLLVDSQSAKDLSGNSLHHERTKHIDIAYHFVRDEVNKGSIEVVHVPTSLQVADSLTKGVNFKILDWFKDRIRLKAV